MKKTFYLLLLIMFSVGSLMAQSYSYEIKMDNFAQVSETEIQWDISLRKGVGSSDWALHAIQMRWQYNLDIYHSGTFESVNLTIITDETDLIVKSGWFSNNDFTKINPGALPDQLQWAVINTPVTGDPVTVFDNYEWKKIARFSAQLTKNSLPHNFADMDPEFAFEITGLNLIVRRCDYTGSNPTAVMAGVYSWEIDPTHTTRVVIPAQGVKVNDRQLAGYWFSGDGNWNDIARWNNVTNEYYHYKPMSNSNAIINGHCTIQHGTDVSLLPTVGGDGGELTVLTGEETLYQLTGSVVATGAGGLVNIWSNGVGSTNLGNPVSLPSGTTVTLQAIDFQFPPYVSWTSNPAGAGTFGSPSATVTTYTTPAFDVEAIATFSWTKGANNILQEENFIAKSVKSTLYASLTIAGGGTLTVETLYNDNENGEEAIIVQSPVFDPINPPDPLPADGSLINNNAGVPVTVERYITSERWHYVSPPISDGLSGIFYDIYLKEWDEPTGTFFYIVPVNVPLNTMEGYGTWASDFYTGTTTVYYEGILNTGSLNSGVLTNTSSALHNSKGFNFVGNPYPSAINWDVAAGWTKTNLDDAIYIWNPAVGQYGSYVGGTSTNQVTNIIPGGQGFYIHVTTGNPTGSLTVNNTARLHDNKPFFKNSGKSITTDLEFINLQISTELNSYSDQAVVQFNEIATENFDPTIDAYDLEGLDEAPGLYFVIEDNARLSINTYPELDENIIIPLYCTVGIDGYYTIEALSILNFLETTEVLLEDKVEEVIIDLKEQNSYTFFASETDDHARFNLRFMVTPDNTIEISDNRGIQIYASNGVIYLKRQDANTLDGEIRVFDLLGRLIVAENIEGTQHYEMTLDYEGILLITFSDNSDRKEYRQKVHLK